MDIQILNFINDYLHGCDFINQLAKIISIISDNGYIWIALGLFLMIFKKTRKAGFVTLCGVLATLLVNTIVLKNVFARPRPFVENSDFVTFLNSIGMSLPLDNSFPSGHTFVSFCCSAILVLELRKKWGFIYILSSCIALSRIFLCVHYPTDVLAGALIGTLVGVGVYFLANYIIKKVNKKKLFKNSTSNNQLNSDIETEE